MEKFAYFYVVWNATVKSIEALEVFFETMNDLVLKGVQGDDKALFKAIYISSSITALLLIAQRVKQAEFINDKDFLRNIHEHCKEPIQSAPIHQKTIFVIW